MQKQVKTFLKRWKHRYFFPKPLSQVSDLHEIALYTIGKHRLKTFTFLEIGVFKGENASVLMEKVKHFYSIDVRYIGFDLFDDVDHLKEKYPEDYKQYNREDCPYFEFESGGHTYDKVVETLSRVMNSTEYQLIRGDTTITLKDFLAKSRPEKIDLVFIDGCHDYEVVKSDWLHSSTLFTDHPHLVIAFDDYAYEGVKAVHDEISKEAQYLVRALNPNQFMVQLNSRPQ